MKFYSFFILTICFFQVSSVWSQQSNYLTLREGSVAFTSQAPLETITAESTQLKGIIDPATQKFAFTVYISSFQGFNGPLQKDHFNENYLESKLFPSGTFTGKIIENIDFSKDGEYVVRAKGALTIHGVKRERIIKSTLTIKGNEIKVNSVFTVLLKEHDINIPKIVNQKIAKEIFIVVDAIFENPDF